MPADNDWSFSHPFNVLEQSALVAADGTKIYRPTVSLVLESTLNGRDDVDILLYNKTSSDPLLFFALAQVPACLQYKKVYPTIALLGPTWVEDSNGEPIFSDDVPFSLPSGYGAYVVRHPQGRYSTRPAFIQSRNTGLGWMYPQGYTTGCSHNPSVCGEEGILSVTVSAPAAYYWAIWGEGHRPLISDVGLVAGYTEGFSGADALRLTHLLPAVRNGATLHGQCLPLPAGFLTYPEG
jgi:hypothetical protein